MFQININERISYLPSSDSPLSSDVFWIKGDKLHYIYDVGNCDEAKEFMNQVDNSVFILSHFHIDHIGNMRDLEADKVYLGKKTYEKIGHGEIVKSKVVLVDGVRLELFPLPSSHAKDCIAVNVDNEYLLVGDALYAAQIQGRYGYNVSILHDTIETLKRVETKFVLKSHDIKVQNSLETELAMLEEIYSKRVPGEPYIFISP